MCLSIIINTFYSNYGPSRGKQKLYISGIIEYVPFNCLTNKQTNKHKQKQKHTTKQKKTNKQNKQTNKQANKQNKQTNNKKGERKKPKQNHQNRVLAGSKTSGIDLRTTLFKTVCVISVGAITLATKTKQI